MHITEDDGWTALAHSVKNGSYQLLTIFWLIWDLIFTSKVNHGTNYHHIAALNGNLNFCKAFFG